jgi:hypothetical protein
MDKPELRYIPKSYGFGKIRIARIDPFLTLLSVWVSGLERRTLICNLQKNISKQISMCKAPRGFVVIQAGCMQETPPCRPCSCEASAVVDALLKPNEYATAP